MKKDGVPVRFYRFDRRARDGVVEAFGIRMGKNDGDLHLIITINLHTVRGNARR
jgi:hypothetical protein